jgi:hypothetical protein
VTPPPHGSWPACAGAGDCSVAVTIAIATVEISAAGTRAGGVAAPVHATGTGVALLWAPVGHVGVGGIYVVTVGGALVAAYAGEAEGLGDDEREDNHHSSDDHNHQNGTVQAPLGSLKNGRINGMICRYLAR